MAPCLEHWMDEWMGVHSADLSEPCLGYQTEGQQAYGMALNSANCRSERVKAALMALCLGLLWDQAMATQSVLWLARRCSCCMSRCTSTSRTRHHKILCLGQSYKEVARAHQLRHGCTLWVVVMGTALAPELVEKTVRCWGGEFRGCWATMRAVRSAPGTARQSAAAMAPCSVPPKATSTVDHSVSRLVMWLAGLSTVQHVTRRRRAQTLPF